MTSLSLISLNIERDVHFERILPFFEAMRSDVVCLQEVEERHVPKIEAVVGKYSFFVPMNRRVRSGEAVTSGVGIFSRLPLAGTTALAYAGERGELELFDRVNSAEQKVRTQRFSVALATIEKEGTAFRIGTTHFPWTPDGLASDAQRVALKNLLAELEAEPELILCGDFNAPRGGEIFSAMAAKWQDNVPAEYTSSIDGSLHRAGQLPYMVDGLFSTPEYKVSNVVMHTGVSDHCALSAVIERV